MKAQAGVDIAASEREVWTVLADIASWPTWNPAVRHAVSDDELELEVGSKFRFSTEIGTLKCKVTRIDSPNLLEWKGRVLVLGERQVWRVTPTGSGSRLDVEAEMTGFFSRLLRRRLDARLQRVMDALVQLLRLEAEARSAEARDEAANAEAQGRADADG